MGEIVRYTTIVDGARRLSPTAASLFHTNVLLLSCCETGITMHAILRARLNFNYVAMEHD
jgi:hypothetical protein